MAGTKFLYRYQSYIQPEFMGQPAKLIVHELQLPIVKYNPHSVWVDYFGKRKIVYNGTRKRFAYETKEDALNSLRIRKIKHLQILNHRRDEAQLTHDLFMSDKYEIDKGDIQLE